MSSRKKLLKSYIKFSPRERRIELEDFVDNDIIDEDVEIAINYIEGLDGGKNQHSIIEMGYSSAGFYIKTETGMVFIK